MIKLLLFAHLQERIGKDSFELNITNVTVGQLKAMISEKYDVGSLEHVMVAINEEYALNDDIIREGDVVAFIPPVSGG
ncbi:molybdopterin converting factor subunit 1 [Metabacillus niabensis]|uniref:Molybdopterin synthase sulfur carrier subunit n=1 Tax=Metabacillus niabensis TaxID=324854 RepID=A0ABT9Z3W7_9BACI|nr:molybdopterin converting factor subunit 1 [Metabacillus niabensis]MDQ0226947.1 molybdopterin synthase sulfur carrier subunit [Metabacillus niabensis]